MKTKKLLAGLMTATMLVSTLGAMNVVHASDSSSGEKRTLKFLCVYDESKKELYEMFDKFKEENPDIDLQITAITSSADLNKQLTTLSVSGDLPDLVSIDRMYIGQFASMGILKDITDLVENDPDIDLSTYYEGPLDGCKMDDKFYGMPFTANCLAVYYNADLLKKAGFEKPADGWTWDDYAEIAKKCTDTDNSIWGAVMAGSNDQDGSFQYYPWNWAAGGDILNPQDSDATKESLDFLTGLINDGGMSPEITNWTQTDAANQFAGGKAALFTGGTWNITSFKQNISDFEWGIVPYPVNPNTGKYATCLGGYGLCMTEGGNEDDAWKLIKFIESDEVMSYWNEAQNYIPVRKDIAEASDYFSTDKNIAVYTESMNYAQSRPTTSNFLDVDTQWEAMLQEAYTGTMSVDDAISEYVPKITALTNQ